MKVAYSTPSLLPNATSACAACLLHASVTSNFLDVDRVYKYWPWAPVMLPLTRLPSPSSSTSVGIPLMPYLVRDRVGVRVRVGVGVRIRVSVRVRVRVR